MLVQIMPFSNDKIKSDLFGSGGSIKLGSWDMMQEQNDISKIHSRLQTLESERKRLEVSQYSDRYTLL